jgi:hypothetical protein
MQKRSRRWVQLQLFSFILVAGGFYIWTKHEFGISNSWEKGKDMVDKTMTDISRYDVLRDERILKNEDTERDIAESVSHASHYSTSNCAGYGDDCADNQNFDGNVTDSNVWKVRYENNTMGSQSDKLNVHRAPSFIPTTIKDIDPVHEDFDIAQDMKGELSFVKTRSWIEQGICDELSDMISCPEKQNSVSYTPRKRLSHSDPRDIQTLQRMMVRRQVFTAIGVAMAMTLPQIAPHIFKLNLAQVLSISFWKSLMEFLTVFIQ